MDGSQNFASDKRWGWFPGVSAGWTLTEEDFMKGIKGLDFLKLRASWGQLGNDNVNAFQYLTAYTYGNNATFEGTTYQGLVQNGVPNPNITWEVAETTDIGMEARFFGGKLGMDVDVFKTRRSNILATRNASVPWYTGLQLPDENIGIVENKGIELVLTHRGDINNDWSYSLNGNFTYVTNEVVDVDEVPNSEPYQDATGKPIGAELLYEVIGIFNDDADIASYPHLSGTIPGDPIRKDVNEDGEINTLDRVRQDWTSTPEIVFGLNMSLSYKRFDFSLNWQGQARAKIAGLSGYYYDPVAWGNFPAYLVTDGWSYDNLDGTKPSPALTSSSTISGTTFQYFSSAFLRLKNAEVAYNLPKSATNKIGVDACRVYLSGYNLFSFDALKELNIDPETTNLNTAPPDRIINVGVSLTF